jgi:hypothetical protein
LPRMPGVTSGSNLRISHIRNSYLFVSAAGSCRYSFNRACLALELRARAKLFAYTMSVARSQSELNRGVFTSLDVGQALLTCSMTDSSSEVVCDHIICNLGMWKTVLDYRSRGAGMWDLTTLNMIHRFWSLGSLDGVYCFRAAIYSIVPSQTPCVKRDELWAAQSISARYCCPQFRRDAIAFQNEAPRRRSRSSDRVCKWLGPRRDASGMLWRSSDANR